MHPLRLLAAARHPVLRTTIAFVGVLIAAGAAVVPARPAIAASAVPAGSVSVWFVGAGIWGGNLHSTYALTNRQVSVQFYSRQWRGSGAGTARVSAVVERRADGGTWRATTHRVTSRSATFRTELPAYSTRSTAHDATVAYRIRVRAGGIIRSGGVSAAITVHYRNPARFTGLTRSLYRTVHGYCPSAVVRIVHVSGDAAGEYTTGQYSLRIDSSTADDAPVDRRAVALHECGHYLQWRNYGATNAGWTRMTRDATAIFGTNSSDPVEHMADCIARAANPGGYLGYGGSCTTKQLSASHRMLAGYRVR